MTGYIAKPAPPVHEFPALAMPPVDWTLLPCGIKLGLIGGGEQDVFNLTAVWRGGSAEAVRASLAPLTARLLREGTSDHDGAEVSDMLEFCGAKLHVYSDSHYTVCRLYALSSKADTLLPLFRDIMLSPAFPEEALAVQREQLAQNAAMENHKVEARAGREIKRRVMGEEHPLSRVATPEIIRSITRSEISARWDVISRPSAENLTLLLAGKITPGLLSGVNATFGELPVTSGVTPLIIEPFKPGERGLTRIEMPDTLQSAVRIAWPSIRRDHPDYIGLRILSVALGGYFGSRLMRNIREEKGLTYGINAYLLGYPEGSMLGIDSSADPSGVDRLIEETLAEVRRLSTGDFTSGELTRLKQYMMSNLATALDSPFEMADYAVSCILAHIPDGYFENQVKAIRSLTAGRLAEVARTHLSTDPYIVVAGK